MADEAGVERTEASEPPRIVTANRAQVQLRPLDLESLLAADHRARAIWTVVEQLDLSQFYAAIHARGSEPGRPAIDPKLLIAVWLYGTSEGVGSARELARLCEQHDAYRWLCGGVRVNHHTLSDFRVEHGAALDVRAGFLQTPPQTRLPPKRRRPGTGPNAHSVLRHPLQ